MKMRNCNPTKTIRRVSLRFPDTKQRSRIASCQSFRLSSCVWP